MGNIGLGQLKSRFPGDSLSIQGNSWEMPGQQDTKVGFEGGSREYINNPTVD